MPSAFLKPNREQSILRHHPWVFSGAIASMETQTPGDWIDIYSHKKQYLASGFVGNGSIAIRIIKYSPGKPTVDFWIQQLNNCLQKRRDLNIIQPHTNCFRLAHGEGDFLPGLIIDIYNQCAVVQAHTHGIFNELHQISTALQQLENFPIHSVYNKSAAAMHENHLQDGFLFGNIQHAIALENNVQFKIDWTTGQKTGFFLDQRDNRNYIAQFCRNKEVLNCFSYSGGFSMYALIAGAAKVTSVDVSKPAIDLANENAQLNNLLNHSGIADDVLNYLKNCEPADIVILDPPAFAKSINKKHSAVQGYKRLNALGMKKVKPGGMLFTFSCSQVIDNELFENTIRAAAIESNMQFQIVKRMHQGADHPVNIFHPEGHYLKGLALVRAT